MREPKVLNGLHLVVARNALSHVSDLVRELSDIVAFLNMPENTWGQGRPLGQLIKLRASGALHGLNWPSPRLILPKKRSQKS